ncbi:tetratricopeptide repeat protein [Balneolaceae bacterium YR4-1]|uniref:Tetratricopeptide repeat protein n=1 Tax=Halalkalibaculum roseum TaxID=2709311 RepID=A0A6M1SUW9_9BACT|nr:tetratricopeptide repeat protein [Halalkalibaculum roseum]NGP76602.1 tetratricopeptide repeat protein [Halalkalibaculum roseum]
MAKKLTQEELEQDPLLQSYAKVQSFYLQNKNTIIWAGVAVILLIALSFGYYYYSQQQETRAQELMGMAETYYLNGNYESALMGSEEDFTVGFEQIINNYSGTDAANLARYYAAVCEYKLGNTEQALNYINSYEFPDGIMGVAPLSFKGVLLTEVGNHEEAAQTYVEAAELDLNESTTPYNYLEAANAFQDAGDMEQAREYAQRIVDEYPNSAQVAEAQRLLGKTVASGN